MYLPPASMTIHVYGLVDVNYPAGNESMAGIFLIVFTFISFFICSAVKCGYYILLLIKIIPLRRIYYNYNYNNIIIYISC